MMSATNSEKPHTKARLLCVDDDRRLLALSTAILEAAGYHVATATDAGKALALATGAAFDLAILDYDMPDMNGVELACLLKQQKCDLPIILFSGNLSLPAEAFNIVDEHVIKGQSVESLLQVVSTWVNKKTEAQPKHIEMDAREDSFFLARFQAMRPEAQVNTNHLTGC